MIISNRENIEFGRVKILQKFRVYVMIVFFIFDSKNMEDCMSELLSIMISAKTRLSYQRVVSTV